MTGSATQTSPSPERDETRRRALNTLWNAAADYSIEATPWQVFTESGGPGHTPIIELQRMGPAGKADTTGAALLYRNLASGLSWKWFDGAAITRFAATWEEDYRCTRLDELCWLAFEEASFCRELPQRPALRSLRQAFLDTLPESGHAAIRALECADAEIGQDEVCARMMAAALKLYRFDGRCIRTPDTTLHLGVSLLGLAMRDTGNQRGREKLRIRPGLVSAGKRPSENIRLGLASLRDERAARKAQANRAYVERCFGPLLCTPAFLQQVEHAACTGVHAESRLWLADGSRAPGDLSGREFRTMQANANDQLAANRAFYATGKRTHETAIDKLAHSLGDRLRSTTRFPERGHVQGNLDPRAAWRASTLGDSKVFLKKVPLDAPEVQVDLLLDASGSRSGQQEAIATQAFILGQALARCRIPVRISAFSSLRDHTVIRVFCDYGKPNQIGNVMRYFAAGMNRDGLALRAMGQLMDPVAAQGRQRLLLVLTDGSPMDDHTMVGTPGMRGDREYLGKPAVRDTAAQVRQLRRDGIQVAALYQGPDDYLGNARLIYGTQLARIQRIELMAETAARLVTSALES